MIFKILTILNSLYVAYKIFVYVRRNQHRKNVVKKILELDKELSKVYAEINAKNQEVN